MNRIRLKGRDRRILEQLNSPTVSHNGNGNGKLNGNGNGRAIMAKKKTTTRRKPSTKADTADTTIEAPVRIRVLRTVKKRLRDDHGNLITEESQASDEVTPEQTDAESGDNLDWETIEIRKFATEPARVRFNFNLSPTVHYQGASAGVSVELPCYVEEIPDALVEAEEKCLAHLRPKVKELRDTVNHLIKQKIDKERELRDKGLI